MKKIIVVLFSLLSLISFSVSVVIPQKLLLENMKPVLQKAKTYEKFKAVFARKAVPGEILKTYTSDGYETQNTAGEGDFVVRNTTDAKEMYILTKEKFEKRYKYLKKLDSKWNVYQPLGKVKAVKADNTLIKKLGVEGIDFSIETSWNEEMTVKKGDFLVSPLDYSEVYRIADKEFYETYRAEK
ncbi:MAG: hypothetical protein LBV03_06725 [Fusobacteriales bacterium]|jgi:uncharacterized protein YxeA|nr:hypothetical protein [Fusobacteriales bacterium]